MTKMKHIGLALIVMGSLVGSAAAFPSWMGVYGETVRHNGGNPGTFTVLMNQDYLGLHAEVGMQVDGGAWFTVPMSYVGNMDGNSIYEVTPTFTFTEGENVTFYFHGWDDWGGNIWDSNAGNNYSFMVGAGGASEEVQVLDYSFGVGLGCYGLCGHLDLDVEIQTLSSDRQVDMVYTTDGIDWSVLPLAYLETLASGNERWGYHNNFGLRDDTVQFAVRYRQNGNEFWDNNDGQDYFLGDLPPYWGQEVSRVRDDFSVRTVGSGGSCGFGEGDVTVEFAVHANGSSETAGIVWTANGVDWHLTPAIHDAALSSNFQQYRVDVVNAGSVSCCSFEPECSGFDFQYAIYYDDGTTTHWDNNGGQDYVLHVNL